ncbi:hypothetical protein F4808DRAFT_470650 [Astrocystis sublimbata]|nr:hypothetical protein F4808DRAFT_470650 [Astrocystis sublimbata]
MATSSIYDLPAHPPPPGVSAQIGHAPNRNSTTVGVISLCLILSTIGVALRVYARFFVLRKVQLQDYLMLLSFSLYVTFNGLYLNLVHSPGWFVHIWDLTLGEFVDFLHYGVVATSVFLGFYIPIKSAILLEWLSLFVPGGSRRSIFFWSCHLILWANLLFCAAELFLVNLACTPAEYAWNRTIKGHCAIDTGYTSLSSSIFAFVTDALIFFVPQRIIWTLNMTWRRKLGVSVVFALGLAACTASLIRLYYTVQRNQGYDLSYRLSSVQLTAVGEGAAALLVFCVPATPKAVAAIRESRLGKSLLPWSSLVSIIRRHHTPQASQESSQHGDTAPYTTLVEKTVGNNQRWQGGISSESDLIPLSTIPSAKMKQNHVDMNAM